MRRIFSITLALTICSNANASRCGLAVTFANAAPIEISIQASIEWQEMETDTDEEDNFPGDVAHPIKLDAHSKETELFAFPCGYSSDPQEFWVNYSIVGVETFKRVKYVKGMEIEVSNGT